MTATLITSNERRISRNDFKDYRQKQKQIMPLVPYFQAIFRHQPQAKVKVRGSDDMVRKFLALMHGQGFDKDKFIKRIDLSKEYLDVVSVAVVFDPANANLRIRANVQFRLGSTSKPIDAVVWTNPDGDVLAGVWFDELKKKIADKMLWEPDPSKNSKWTLNIGTSIVSTRPLSQTAWERLGNEVKIKVKSTLKIGMNVGKGVMVGLEFFGAAGAKVSGSEFGREAPLKPMGEFGFAIFVQM